MKARLSNLEQAQICFSLSSYYSFTAIMKTKDGHI